MLACCFDGDVQSRAALVYIGSLTTTVVIEVLVCAATAVVSRTSTCGIHL